jgi:hypothetical protein
MIRQECSIWILVKKINFYNGHYHGWAKQNFINRNSYNFFICLGTFFISFYLGNMCVARNVEQWNNNILEWSIPIVFQNFHKCIIKIFILVKWAFGYENWIKGCCIVDFERDGNSSNFMITLGLFVEKHKKN